MYCLLETCSTINEAISEREILKEYRDAGKLSFIALPGKVLYKKSDIRKLLENRYQKAWRSSL